MDENLDAKEEKEIVLEITEYNGYKLPDFEEEIDLEVRVFSWTDPDFSEIHKVKIKL